jgi:hypothetical protein
MVIAAGIRKIVIVYDRTKLAKKELNYSSRCWKRNHARECGRSALALRKE